ncbi:sugar phosphate nucleotidyltransferase [Candidatus Kuenenia stuttgartensis]|uniref:sugar phosphate nucleotidyltransferase n=1 Tax=Kuenenia stuttgartiensis TaxID=174633 RepID=UPI001B8B1029|nr:sugar phosphate nucleotidyltransferase [Candidatus Kuenenia stuttgartiensis]
MNYQHFIREHIKSGAEVTVSAIPSERRHAQALGLLKINEQGRIVGFLRNLKMKQLSIRFLWMHHFLRKGWNKRENTFGTSMGIYLFNIGVLKEVLKKSQKPDFGKEIIPGIIKERAVHAYLFDGYWEDIGTIKSFYEANLELATLSPRFNLYSEKNPIYTSPLSLPGAIINNCRIIKSFIADGCILIVGK